MKYTNLKKAGMVLAAMMITTSAHAYNKEDAKGDCAVKVMNHGNSQYYGMHDTRVVDNGHHNYKVTGKLLSKRDKETHGFSCKIRHREVINWNVKSSHKGSSDKAIAIGAGILAIAAIAAAANKNKHTDHDKGASAFDDMAYLKRQCKRNILHHMKNSDSEIKSVRLDSTHLRHRTLRGEGGMSLKRGGGSDFSYTCKFDRRGNIYDGDYNFH